MFRLCDKFPQGFGIGVTLIKKFLRREIDSAVADGFTRFMSGFADGVDQYFAEIVLEKKKTYPIETAAWWNTQTG